MSRNYLLLQQYEEGTEKMLGKRFGEDRKIGEIGDYVLFFFSFWVVRRYLFTINRNRHKKNQTVADRHAANRRRQRNGK